MLKWVQRRLLNVEHIALAHAQTFALRCSLPCEMRIVDFSRRIGLENWKLAADAERIESNMPNNLMLRNTSLLLLLLLTLHVVDDVVHGFDSAGLLNMIGIVALGLLLYGTLVLHERVSGHIVMLFIALFSALMPIVHLRSARINETVQASGGFFFIWTLWALGGVGIFGIILATQGLLNLRRNRRRDSEDA